MSSASTPLPSRARAGGYAVALCAAAILSTTAIFIRYLSVTYHLPALVLALWRDIFVVITLAPILTLVRPALVRVSRPFLPYLGLYGLVLAAFNALWTLSVALNGAAAATVLVYSSGAFTVVLGRLVLRERLNWAKAAAVVLSLGGCVLVSDALNPAAWRANVAGIATGVLSGLSYAVYSLMGRSASQRGIDPWTTLLYIFGFASIILFGCNLVPGGFFPGAAARPGELLWLGRSLAGWGILFLLSAGPTVSGFGLYLVSLARLPSSVANLIVSAEPAFTALTAYLLLGERLVPVQIVGAVAIMAGVVLLRLHVAAEGPTER